MPAFQQIKRWEPQTYKAIKAEIVTAMHRDYGDDADLPRGIPHHTVQEWEDIVRRRRLSTTDTLEWERQIQLYGEVPPDRQTPHVPDGR